VTGLPDTVGRVLGLNEGPQPLTWLIEDLICAEGFSALGVSNRTTRNDFGLAIIDGLLEGGTVFGKRVKRPVDRVLIIAGSEHIARKYRGQRIGDDRVCVVAAKPWDGEDESYWPSLYAVAADRDVVLIDAVQGLANGSVTRQILTGIDGFAVPVVGLYEGNEAKPGIGGSIGWSNAIVRTWWNYKTNVLVPVDLEVPAWSADGQGVTPLTPIPTAQPRSGGLKVHDFNDEPPF